MTDRDMFHERTDKLLAGTLLGGEQLAGERLVSFSWMLAKDNGCKYWLDAESDGSRTCSLIAGIAYIKSMEEPYTPVLASDVIDYLKRYDNEKLKQNIQGHIEKMDAGNAKVIGDFMKPVLESDKLSSYRVDAIKILNNEKELEEERQQIEEKYGQKGDYITEYQIGIKSAYQWGKGMYRDEEFVFSQELQEILPHDGWKFVKGDWDSADMLVRGNSNVYLHPMQFSITARENEVKELVSYFEKLNPQSFKIASREDRRGEVLKDMTCRELYDTYSRNIKDIRNDILSNVNDKASMFNIIETVYRKNRIGNITEYNLQRNFSPHDVGSLIIKEEIEKMINKKIISVDDKNKVHLVNKTISIDEKTNEKKHEVSK